MQKCENRQAETAEKDPRVSPRAFGKTEIWLRLLDLDLGADFFELLLDLFGLLFGNAFLEGLGSFVDESLCFFKSESGDVFYSLNNFDFAFSAVFQNYVKFA